MLHRIALTLTLLLLLSAAAQAQTKLPPRKPIAPRQRVVVKGETMKDGVMMKASKVLVTQQGLTNVLTQEMTLTNGTKISPAGAVTMTNGTTTTLQEGDLVSLSGRLTTAAMKAEQDSLTQARREQLKAKGKRKK